MSGSAGGRNRKRGQLDPESTDAESGSESDLDRNDRAPDGSPSVADSQNDDHVASPRGAKSREAVAISKLVETKSRRKLKKQRRLVEAGKGNPQDYYDVYGANPRAEVVLHPQGHNDKLRLQEVQGLVTWVLGEGSSPKWCFVKNKPLISKVVLLFVPGLDPALFLGRPDLFPAARALGAEPRKTAALSPSAEPMGTLQALLTCPVSRKRKERMMDDQVRMRATLTGFRPTKRSRVSSNDDAPPQQSVREEKEEGEISEEEGGVGGRRGPSDDNAEETDGEDPEDQRLRIAGCGTGHGMSTPHGALSEERLARHPHSAGHYVLTESQMAAEEFPRATLGEDGVTVQLPSGYVVTRPAPSGVVVHQMLAVDCEMCTTTVGLELTRVTVVTKAGKVLYDKLVVPPNPITNYNTKFSGITYKMLEGVTTSLSDVQRDLLEILFEETILVGHALVNDLQALKLIHRRAIDTAVMFPHPRGPPFRPALRMLAERFLHRKIQGLARGHDSAEDAKAAMDLALLKIRRGPDFGCRPSNTMEGESLVAVLGRRGRRCSLVDRLRAVRQHAVGTASALPCTSDADVLAKAVQEVKSNVPHFVWARFTDIVTHHEQAAKNDADVASRSAAMASLLTCTRDEADTAALGAPLEEVLRRVDERIGRLHEALPPNTLLIVATGHGDTAIVRRLQEMKWKRIQAAQTGLDKWDEGGEKVLQEFQRRAKTGLVFTVVKS